MPDAPTLYTTGPAGVGRDLVRASADSLDSTTLATIILVVVILLLVYRAPLLALVPLLTIAVSVWVALKLLALCTLIPGFHLVNISQIFAVVMLYGAGTDYCLFLISRYREELAAGQRPEYGPGAQRRGRGRRAGGQRRHGDLRAGPDGLRRVRQGPLRRPGHRRQPGASALAASLTLAPALLRILGPAVFWPVGLPRNRQAAQPGAEPLWGWLSRQVVGPSGR